MDGSVSGAAGFDNFIKAFIKRIGASFIDGGCDAVIGWAPPHEFD
jgi:hypothetical protein